MFTYAATVCADVLRACFLHVALLQAFETDSEAVGVNLISLEIREDIPNLQLQLGLAKVGQSN